MYPKVRMLRRYIFRISSSRSRDFVEAMRFEFSSPHGWSTRDEARRLDRPRVFEDVCGADFFVFNGIKAWARTYEGRQMSGLTPRGGRFMLVVYFGAASLVV